MSLRTILVVMTSSDLNIDLTRKSLFYKSCRSFIKLSNAVCRLSLRFVVFDIWREAEKAPHPIWSLSEPVKGDKENLGLDYQILNLSRFFWMHIAAAYFQARSNRLLMNSYALRTYLNLRTVKMWNRFTTLSSFTLPILEAYNQNLRN